MFFKKTKVDFSFSDIHTHILPGIDDGAKDIATSVQMVEIAYDEGIRSIVATPHLHPGKCTAEYEKVNEIYKEFQNVVSQLHEEMKIYLGREIYDTCEYEDRISELGMSMNGSRYVLVEFDFMTGMNEIRNAVHNIVNEGMIPVVAHVERYERILGEDDFIYELREMGAVIQVNAGAVLGKGGNEQKHFVRTLLSQELVDIVATDAHSAGHRAPYMKECAGKIIDKYGKEYAKKIMHDNPEKVIAGEYLS